MAVTDLDLLTQSPGPMARHPHSGAAYHEGADVIAHLSRCLGPAGWSWTTGEHGYDQLADQVWVTGTLTARLTVLDAAGDELVIGTTHTERGWHAASRKRSDNSFVDLGSDYKAADTDALKRAARLLGVGLDAWQKTSRQSAVGSGQWRPAADRRPPTADSSSVEPLSPSARLDAVATYVDLLAQAQAADFRASWTTAEPGAWSDVQLAKYSSLLEHYLARQQRPAAPAV
jgi:hypothetical protein